MVSAIAWGLRQMTEKLAVMPVREVLGSLPFRYIAKYVTVLSAAVFVFLAAIYAYFSYTSFKQLSESIVDELDSLELVYHGQGLEGVSQYINDQLALSYAYPFSYLVTNSLGEKVAGDLPPTPSYREFDDGWLGFEMSLQNWGEEVDFLARPVQLGDGYRAFVARDYADLVARAELVFSTLFRAMIATLILGITGGFFSAASTLRRVERLNRELSTIVRDDPGKRLDASGERGYVRQLAIGMNTILEQMESLMQGVRSVSDNIAHDLRTPLTRVRNKLSQLREGLEPSQQGEEVDRIIEDCDDLLDSFNALLRISTLESGSRLAGGAEVDLQALLRDVVELYEPLAQQRGIALRLEAPASAICHGEADLLFQMYTNLLDNAVKYTPEQGEISVSLQGGAAPGAGYTVVIADSGPGIPAQEHKNVFRRFYRVEPSRSEQPGHGLGLSLAQAIAHYHGGSLELAANKPGLLVKIHLP